MLDSCQKKNNGCCRNTIAHINRIIGQLNSLKQYIENDESCQQITSLVTSISKSCDGLRTRTLEGFILNDVIEYPLSDDKKKLLAELLKRYKK